jgi:hypothetical protein
LHARDARFYREEEGRIQMRGTVGNDWDREFGASVTGLRADNVETRGISRFR